MDSSPYGVLLEKTRLPQPPLQRYAVSALFRKLRTAPPHRGFESREGRDAVSLCLNSSYAAVLDQSVREICTLVTSRVLKFDAALVELQSALEGCESRFVDIFVKSIGFLCRWSFREDPSYLISRLEAVELHPFVRVLSSRSEAPGELRRQVIFFILQNTSGNMEVVLEFIRPFVIFSILSIQSSVRYSTFSKDMMSDLASLCCSLSTEALGIVRLLTGCLRYFPMESDEEFRCLTASAECLVDAFEVVLKQMIKHGTPEAEMLTFRVESLEALLSVFSEHHKPCRWMFLVELLMRLLVAQKDFGLPYLPEFSLVAVSMSALLCRAEFEHEQLTILKLLFFLKQWMVEEKNIQESTSHSPLDLLQIFPAVNILSSTSESIKDAVVSFLFTFEAYIPISPATQGKSQTEPSVSPTSCSIGSILSRLLEHLWTEEKKNCYCTSFIEYAFKDSSNQTANSPALWLHNLRDHCFRTAQQLKLNPSFHHQENTLSGIHSLLCAVTSTLIFHPQLMSLAIDSLASLASMDPKFSVTLFLGNLFYIKIFSSSRNNSERDLLKLLEMLPKLASSSALVPLILQILVPMLQEDANSVLYAMAVRLLCKTWMLTDRVFETLQAVLEPRAFLVFSSELDVCLSIAASIRDVCRHNPDRGVDLILSVSSCIESRDSSVQALGFEAISYLCEADVIDFYSAWYIIEKNVLDYSEDPIVALGLCTLLRWGALDAEASPEASARVVQILWQVGILTKSRLSEQWVKAHISALQSLKYFEVEHIVKVVPDFAIKTLEFLLSDNNTEIQKAMEDLVARIFNFEHINRRRAVKQNKPVIHKVAKLLDIFPKAVFSLGEKQKRNVGELPGAALLSMTLFSKDLEDTSNFQGKYEAFVLEVSESLSIGTNIFVALLAFQSWKSFLSSWLMAVTDNGASMILKILLRIAEESIPRVAENIAIAIGALCMVLPPSGYTVLLDASSFLLKWLFQYEHEQRQWASAISLGLISNSLHITDKSQKFDIINGLMEVLKSSWSYHVKGACGTGLGFACQNLLTHVNDHSERTITEAKLLTEIILSLSSTLILICPSSSTQLMSMCESFLLDQDKEMTETLKNFPVSGLDDVDDFWGAAGLVLGLGNTVSALYRFGSFDTIKIIKDTLISWIPSKDTVCDLALSIGSCFVLPSVIIFCERAELADIDLPSLLLSYSSLISRLGEIEDYDALSQHLFMASSIGIGSLLSFILNEGVHSLKLDDVISIFESMRNLYTRPYPPIIQLGGMLGVVNAFGAGAVNMTEVYARPLGYDDNSKDALHIRGPIFGIPVLEPFCTSLIQEMFVIAKESEDKQIRRNSSWSISFLRHWWQSGESQTVQDSRNVSENTLVWGFCSWLNAMEMNNLHNDQSIVSVLSCLSKAPRLPSSIDFGPIIKRFMRYGSNIVRKECLSFSLVHASSYNSLLLFLDALVLGPRFGTLQLNLQCFLLFRLSEFMKIFSASRYDGFQRDLLAFFSSSPAYMLHGENERSLLRISLWKGLHQCIIDAFEKSTLSGKEEKCIELLFGLLPVSHSDDDLVGVRIYPQEFMEAVNCLSVAPRNLLLTLLQVSKTNFLSDRNHQEEEDIKKVMMTSHLVLKGCLPVSDLGKMKAFILNSKTDGTWNVLLEVVAALCGADISVKRQWVLDAMEISCVSSHPATALQFVGILSGQCCEYMPLLILSPEAVLIDLPLTLPSLLLVNDWIFISEKLVEMLWESTKRICSWAYRCQSSNESYEPAHIDPSQSRWSSLLAYAMKETCMSLKHCLSFEKRLELAALKLPRDTEA